MNVTSCAECKYSEWDSEETDQGTGYYVSNCKANGNCPNARFWEKIRKALDEEGVEYRDPIEVYRYVILKFDKTKDYRTLHISKEPYSAESFVSYFKFKVDSIASDINAEADRFIKNASEYYRREYDKEEVKKEIETLLEILNRLLDKFNQYYADAEEEEETFDGYASQ